MLVVLGYTWVVEPLASNWVRFVPTVVVIALAVARALRTGEWGLSRSAFLPALRWAAVLTAAAVLAIGLAGWQLGTWHDRRALLGNVAVLIPWGLGQQFALQTVLLREAQGVVSSRTAIWLAALAPRRWLLTRSGGRVVVRGVPFGPDRQSNQPRREPLAELANHVTLRG